MGFERIDEETGLLFKLRMTTDLRKDLDIYYSQSCPHETKEIRRPTLLNRHIQYRYQCLNCGELIGSAISSRTIPQNVIDADVNLRELNKKLRSDAYEAIFQKHIKIQKRESDDRAKWYGKYLKSNAWKDKRQKVLERANGLCEGCRDAEPTAVHHLTYDHLGDELLFELVALCDRCHLKCHPEVSSTGSAVSSEAEESDFLWDESPCCGCRNGDGGYWCFYHDVSASEALADPDFCGPEHNSLEPLK